MILIALGANIVGPAGTPIETLEAAVERMGECGITILSRSHWYQTSPVPASDQPDYINGVAIVETALEPEKLMAHLHALENEFGRTRQQRWEARALDLDLLAYHEFVTLETVKESAQDLIIPHPRLHLRRFVLEPLVEIALEWRHPTYGMNAGELLAKLTDSDRCEPIHPRGI